MQKIDLTRKLRNLLGFTVSQMAAFMGCTRRTIEKWESRNPPIPEAKLKFMILKVMKAWKLVPIPPVFIMDGTGKPWDVVTPHTLLSVVPPPKNESGREIMLLRTLATDHKGVAYIHATYFDLKIGTNQEAFRTIENWPCTLKVDNAILSTDLLSPYHIP